LVSRNYCIENVRTNDNLALIEMHENLHHNSAVIHSISVNTVIHLLPE